MYLTLGRMGGVGTAAAPVYAASVERERKVEQRAETGSRLLMKMAGA